VARGDLPVTPGELLRWAESLAGVARTGLGFTQSLYERERFEEILKIAADIRCAVMGEVEAAEQVAEWLGSVGVGVPGYVTPKTAVGAVVGNDAGEILLVKRAGSGVWLYPTGWADIGYSPSEVAVKEVFEETGIEIEPVALIGTAAAEVGGVEEGVAGGVDRRDEGVAILCGPAAAQASPGDAPKGRVGEV
jgi:hypothetical protein